MFLKNASALLIIGTIWCAACSPATQEEGTSIPAAAGAPAPVAAQVSTLGLGGTSWQLVRFQGSDDTVLTPDDKNKYTMAFDAAGRVSVRIDCNHGGGTWRSSGPPQLEFGPLALNDRLAKDWQYVRSYVMKDGHLFLSLMADGGIYEFEPVA